ncbi:GPO family capsid scaffolding protein [Vibrio splendidus]|uniref:GPO family capsid scaffolding protein n=1 Tax=Vibrio splendidus TaxID=29497 RepID=UPI002236620D|nr:GPO family capsid scaffolding protein [Vibrio splendidus]MCW4444002.1 GPO family capsid scaffolding protein [Vibrio splendidus]
MFKSEPICILTAGPTIDGRDITQKIIDDIADTYDPHKYAARINDDHSSWSWKGGTVLSVEKRGAELWAEIKPNSHLLRNIENGQLLHTSCEFYEDFASTGRAYLTGLAFTDEPASLGTTQVHLSAKAEEKVLVSSGQTLNVQKYSNSNGSDDESLLRKFLNMLKSTPDATKEQLSNQEESEDMSKELEDLLKQSIEQGKHNQQQLSQLNEKVEKLNVNGEEETPPEDDGNKEVTELKGQVETLSSTVGELKDSIEKLSKLTDEDERQLAGQDGEEEPYL